MRARMCALVGRGGLWSAIDRAAAVSDWRDFVETNERYLRPTEVDELQGDASKARNTLGRQPKTSFPQLVWLMLEAGLREAGVDPDVAFAAPIEPIGAAR